MLLYTAQIIFVIVLINVLNLDFGTLFQWFGFHQHVSTPTQISGSGLALIFTNTYDPYIVTMPFYFTDHHFTAVGFLSQ